MKEKLNVIFLLIYIATFSNFLLELVGLNSALTPLVLLILDIGIIYLGLSEFKRDMKCFYILLFIILFTFFNLLYNQYSIITYLNGLRELFILILIFPFFESLSKNPYRFRFKKKFFLFVKIFLVFQIPITLHQFLLYGAGDFVGGSLGFGYSGTLTLLIVPMVYLLIKHGRNKIGAKSYYNCIFLFPLFINETKISFILIPIMFLLLANFKEKKTVFLSLIGGVALFISLNILYSKAGGRLENPFVEIFNEDFIESYLFGEAGGDSGVPRMTKIVESMDLLNNNVVTFLVGIETGTFKGGSVIDKSEFSRQYSWLLTGSRPYMFYLLISGGWLLFATFIYLMLYKLYWNNNRQWDKKFICLLTLILIITMFYSDAFRAPIFVILYATFIYIGKGYFNKPRFRKLKTIHDSVV